MVLDAKPEAFGFTLDCIRATDGTGHRVPWHILPGTLETTTNANTWLERFTCVNLQEDICHFSMHNLDGNLPTGTNSLVNQPGDPGWFELSLEGQTVVLYEEMSSSAYDKTYCVGLACDSNNSRNEQKRSNQNYNVRDQDQDQNHDSEECLPVSLELTLDEKPLDTSFSLICHDVDNESVKEIVWEASPTQQGHAIGKAHETLTRRSCVKHNQCCTFTIQDTAGDGLTKGQYGYFVLEIDYEWSLYNTGIDNIAFTQLVKSFGSQECSTSTTGTDTADTHTGTPVHEIEGDCDDPNDKKIELTVQLDDHPEETSFTLVCSSSNEEDDRVIWNVPRTKLQSSNTLQHKLACLSPEQTCVFNLVDSEGTGITSEQGFELLYDGKTVAKYQYTESGPFTTQIFCVGKYCEPKAVENDVAEEKEAQDSDVQKKNTSKEEIKEDGPCRLLIWIGVGVVCAVFVLLKARQVLSKQKEQAADNVILPTNSTNKSNAEDEEDGATTASTIYNEDEIEEI